MIENGYQIPKNVPSREGATYIRFGFSETITVIAIGSVESITRKYCIFQDMEKHILIGFKNVY